LADKKRIPAYAKDKVITLGDVAIFTNDEEVPLYTVLNSIKEKENLQKISFDISKATPDELRAYFVEVLPNFDRERVYPTDIKRVLNWYNILLNAGITEFAPEEADEIKPESTEVEPEEETKKSKEEVKKEIKSQKTTATPKKSVAPKNTATATKQQPATGKMRQRTKQK
jgi:hypothetical protein